MSTTFSLSNSTALAFDFAHKLLAGSLNVTRDFDSDGILVDVQHEDQYFSTNVMRRLRSIFYRHTITRLEIEDSEVDPESNWSESERRTVRLYTKETNWGERNVATFTLHRDYCDGDNAEGWTSWNVKDVTILLGRARIHLQKQFRSRDESPIWGVRL